jgi:hypothetical protein
VAYFAAIQAGAVPDALKGYRALCNAMTPAKSMHAIKRPMTM